MLFNRYEQEQLLFNMNFKEACSTAGKAAYRGELVLVEGEVGDAQGRRKPPHAVLRQATALADGDKLELLSGSLDDVLNIHELLGKYQADLKPDAILMLFVVNIPNPLVVTLEGYRCYLIPLQDGMAWNEMCDLLGLEKADFKGQSAADKVLTAYAAFADFKPKYPCTDLSGALATRNDAKRESRGPV